MKVQIRRSSPWLPILGCAAIAIGFSGSVAAGPAPADDSGAGGAPGYRCLFNHELLIVSHASPNNREYVESFIRKLAPTDVDAVMCCPTLWRTNFFPSEIDPTWKKYQPGQPPSKFRSWDRAMTYLHQGGDPVAETLAACREVEKAFFISYRMNDRHYVTDLEWPCHNDFWRDHPEYWLGDPGASPPRKPGDKVRLHNYLLPQVRDYYFAILEELSAKYDVDGVELDFQRYPQFFPSAEVAAGTAVMTDFVRRIRSMLNRFGKERNRALHLCVRIPETLEKCRAAGLDVAEWDALGLIDMINISSYYIHTLELGIEEFAAQTRRARIYGEMNYVTWQNSKVDKFARRYTTIEAYRGSALNLIARGVDGLSLFNYDYVPSKMRLPMAQGLVGITDPEFLRGVSKAYVIYPGFGTFPARDRVESELVIPDDTEKIQFRNSVIRVETAGDSSGIRIVVRLNGKALEECGHPEVELFPPVASNEGYADRNAVKFYTVPLDVLISGKNAIRIENLDAEKKSCRLFSMELALFR